MQYSCRLASTNIAAGWARRFLCSPSEQFLRLHGDSEGAGSSRVPASRDASFSAVAPATSPSQSGGPRNGPCHSRCGLVALSGPSSQWCYEYKPLIILNPWRLSFATAAGAMACIEERGRRRRGATWHPGIRPSHALCISTGYRLTLSPGEAKQARSPKSGRPGGLKPPEPFRILPVFPHIVPENPANSPHRVLGVTAWPIPRYLDNSRRKVNSPRNVFLSSFFHLFLCGQLPVIELDAPA